MRKLLIVDVEGSSVQRPQKPAVREQVHYLSTLKKGDTSWELYGKNLDTVAKARAWLMDRRNWFKGQMWIIRWDGLTPTITEKHGQELLDNPDDDGLPEVVIRHQQDVRSGAKEDTEEPSVIE